MATAKCNVCGIEMVGDPGMCGHCHRSLVRLNSRLALLRITGLAAKREVICWAAHRATKAERLRGKLLVRDLRTEISMVHRMWRRYVELTDPDADAVHDREIREAKEVAIDTAGAAIGQALYVLTLARVSGDLRNECDDVLAEAEEARAKLARLRREEYLAEEGLAEDDPEADLGDF